MEVTMYNDLTLEIKLVEEEMLTQQHDEDVEYLAWLRYKKDKVDKII